MEKENKHIFLDLDGCVTESRQIISKEMKKKLKSLKDPFIVVSGAEISRIKKQMNGVKCIMMGQNGNDAPDWRNKLEAQELAQIYDHLQKVSKFCHVPVDGETTHNRGCQVSFSFIGHNADVKWKVKFDPTKKYRNYVLKSVPFKSDTLVVRVAGTTCFDYNRKYSLKGDNLKRYMKLHGLKKKDCTYYGDNFTKGGNDESVLGVMKCVRVKGPDDLLKKLC